MGSRVSGMPSRRNGSDAVPSGSSEAAVYGKPVVFGPVYDKFIEAAGLVEATGGISIDGPLNLEGTLNKLLADEDELKRRGEAAKNYVYANGGASGKIIQFIQEKRLLTR